MIPYGRQDIDDSDIDAVVDVLKGDWLSQGQQSRGLRKRASPIAISCGGEE